MIVSFLFLTIVLKISVSVFQLCLPFLFLPKARLEKMVGVTTQSDTFFRLYGVAMLALTFAYATAFPILQNGQFPWGVAIMGAISNGGATFVLIRSGTKSAKRAFVPIYGVIFLGLIISMVLPELSTKPLL